MSETTSDPIATAITDAVDDLRRAVLRARDGAPTASAAVAFADAIEAVADTLREAAWRTRPQEVRVRGLTTRWATPRG